jgi:hypothetical protein
MVAGIDGGEGSSVGVWREFIFQVQVQVLFERILRGEATRLKEHLARKSGNIHSALNVHQTNETTSYMSCKGSESE